VNLKWNNLPFTIGIGNSKGDWHKFAYVPEHNNQLSAVLPNNRIAIFSAAEFKKLDANTLRDAKRHTFDMKSDKQIRSLTDFIEQL